MAHYPIGINLKGRRCLVVGGGRVAQRKVETLLDFGGEVAVVAPELTPRLQEMVTDGRIGHIAARFRPDCLEGVFVVIAATDDRAVNTEVAREAGAKRTLVNVVDDTQLCTFFVPAIVRRGDLVVGVSTSGRSPALARKLKEQIGALLGEEYGELAVLLDEARKEVKARYADSADRHRALIRILESDVLSLLAEGRREEADKRVRQCI